jgi:GNAT superfamily N-acetyltransferase
VYKLDAVDGASPEAAAVRTGLYAADPSTVPARDYIDLAIIARGRDGALAGGVLGATMWGWLTLDALWVVPAERGTGLGSQLLAAAEESGRQRGCSHARLDTFDFQARAFYEQHGYVAYGALDGFPLGHTQFHLRKALAADSAPAA